MTLWSSWAAVLNDIRSYMGQLAKKEISQPNPNTGNGSGRGWGRGLGRGGFHGPYNNSPAQDDQDQRDNLQALCAVAQALKQLGKASESYQEEKSYNEYPEFFYFIAWYDLQDLISWFDDEDEEGDYKPYHLARSDKEIYEESPIMWPINDAEAQKHIDSIQISDKPHTRVSPAKKYEFEAQKLIPFRSVGCRGSEDKLQRYMT